MQSPVAILRQGFFAFVIVRKIYKKQAEILNKNEEMKVATSYALADYIKENELSEENIIPSALDKNVARVVADEVIAAAIKTGVNRI